MVSLFSIPESCLLVSTILRLNPLLLLAWTEQKEFQNSSSTLNWRRWEKERDDERSNPLHLSSTWIRRTLSQDAARWGQWSTWSGGYLWTKNFSSNRTTSGQVRLTHDRNEPWNESVPNPHGRFSLTPVNPKIKGGMAGAHEAQHAIYTFLSVSYTSFPEWS